MLMKGENSSDAPLGVAGGGPFGDAAALLVRRSAAREARALAFVVARQATAYASVAFSRSSLELKLTEVV